MKLKKVILLQVFNVLCKAKKYHPDVNQGDDTKFKEIKEAYDTLSDPQ